MGVQMAFIPYGLIEAYGAVSLAGRDDSVDIQMNTNGRPLDGIDLKVVIPGTNDEVAPNTVGELMIHGAVMRGYFNMPEQTAAAMGEDGWLRTGDVGVINEAGYVRFVGRIKAMVKVGGENVAVEEVEDCIRRYPGVVECVVVGVPDARKIEVPRAYVVARSESVTAATLTSWCVSHLASFKVPREIILVPDLPRTGSGKVARAEIEAWDFPNL
jgi:fatty-acyl-CoA synthase